jgi:hypothetical protein
MIFALHALVYADDPDRARAFFRDVVRWPSVDTGGGWLIFGTGPSELGVHPAAWEWEGRTSATEQQFDISLMCDDLEATMADLASRGAEFDGGPTQESWGTTVRLVVPGARPMTLYQPAYDPPATSL